VKATLIVGSDPLPFTRTVELSDEGGFSTFVVRGVWQTCTVKPRPHERALVDRFDSERRTTLIPFLQPIARGTSMQAISGSMIRCT
jgi:hypothetical protein